MPSDAIAFCLMRPASFRLLNRKAIMDIGYTLNKIGFTMTDDSEAMDILYWYSAYQKDKEKADAEAKRQANKIRRR